jgi:hypothetical protein
MSDDAIVVFAYEASKAGFTGLFGFHYYNEPLCAWGRVKRLIDRIKGAVPKARFVLWTNGLAVPDDRGELAVFEQINVTDYTGVKAGLQDLPGNVVWRPVAPDGRREVKPLGFPKLTPCRRMYTEMIIDYFGTVHACCHDWRGTIPLGNAGLEPPESIIEKWQTTRANVTGRVMGPHAPKTCLHCPSRTQIVTTFDNESSRRAREEVASVLPPASSGFIAVTAVAFRIPEQRVRDFMTWNRDAFAACDAYVVLVVEEPYDLKDFENVEQVRYTEPMKVFSLCATKNCGIRRAAEMSGNHGVIAATDIDVAIPPATLENMRCLPWGKAHIPLYVMADSYDSRDGADVTAPKATGTVSMHAGHWQQVQYDERCVGYGSDDAILVKDIQGLGVEIVGRHERVFHIAHQQGTCQKEFAGRADHWGRDSGFNPENFEHNGVFYAERGSR